jgi:signal transduction histidine kinase
MHSESNEPASPVPAHAEAALAEYIKQLEAVRAVTEEITQELELTVLLQLITRKAVELVAAAVSGAVFLWDEAAQVLSPQAWHGYGEWLRDIRLRPGEAIVGAVAQRQVGLLVNDYQTSPYAHSLCIEHTGATAILAEPLLYHNRLVGVIVLNNGRTGEGFTTQDHRLLTIFGAQAALSIQNARLFAAVRTQTAQLEQANAALQCEIIERQQAEVALRQARDELERRVAERTTALQLANAQLRQEITERHRTEQALQTFAAQLQRSNRELQDFAYTASHDLQEPLRKILTFGDRLKVKCGETLAEQGRDYLERMQNAAQRMQTLINDLLAFSRVTTKAQPFVPVDLAQVACEVVTDLEIRLEQTGGRVAIDTLPIIEADPLQMRQLFQNLLSNALKFHQQGVAPVVTIQGHILQSADWHLAGSAPVGELCQITVADNGIGFDEKYLDRIFNVFQRLHSRSAYEGSGVGLAVCRKIVERHSGSITARSSPGQGTTFLVTLPMTPPKGATAHV